MSGLKQNIFTLPSVPNVQHSWKMCFGNGVDHAAMLWSVRPPCVDTDFQCRAGAGGKELRQQAWVPPPPSSAHPSPQGSHLLHQTLSSLKLISPAPFPSLFTHPQLSRLKITEKQKPTYSLLQLRPSLPPFRAKAFKAFSPLPVSSSPPAPHSLFSPLRLLPPLPLN